MNKLTWERIDYAAGVYSYKYAWNGIEGNKIFIVGYCGAGKTTLANALGDILKMKVVHLDEELKPIQKYKYSDPKKYQRMKNKIMRKVALEDKEPAIIEGVSLMRSSLSLTEEPLIIVKTDPITAAWRQSWSKTQSTKPWLWAFIHALYRNLIKWRPYYKRLERSMVTNSEHYFTSD